MIKKINKINDIYFIIFSAILGLVAEILFSNIIYKLNITINEPVINKTLFYNDSIYRTLSRKCSIKVINRSIKKIYK